MWNPVSGRLWSMGYILEQIKSVCRPDSLQSSAACSRRTLDKQANSKAQLRHAIFALLLINVPAVLTLVVSIAEREQVEAKGASHLNQWCKATFTAHQREKGGCY